MVQVLVKKKTKNPRAAVAERLIGEKAVRRMKHHEVNQFIDSVTLKDNLIRKVN